MQKHHLGYGKLLNQLFTMRAIVLTNKKRLEYKQSKPEKNQIIGLDILKNKHSEIDII